MPNPGPPPMAPPPAAWNPGPPPGPPPQFAGLPPGPPGPPGLPPVPARGRNPWAIVTGVAALFLVLILGAIAIWAATKDDDKPQPDARRTTTTTTTTRTTPPTTTPTTTTPTTPTSAAQARLMSLLPPGFPPGSCTPDSQPMPGAVVSVKCGQNTDPNGPKVSAFGLYSDGAAVKKAFTAFIGTFTIQGCPGGKASPGTWWHNQDPKTVLGQIACGNYKGNEPQVMWSNEQTLMFGLAAGNPQTLDQLYKWWASHS